MSASWALQQAIYAALTMDDGVSEALDGRVFDTPPRAASFPYCVIGDDVASDWSTATEKGSEHALTVHVWSRADGQMQAKLAAEAVRDALDGAELAITGQVLIALSHLATEHARESDGETVHALLRFRAVLEEGE